MKGGRGGNRGGRDRRGPRGEQYAGKNGERVRGRRVDSFQRGSRDGKGRSGRDRSGDKDPRRASARARKVPVPQMDASNFPSLSATPTNTNASPASVSAVSDEKPPNDPATPRVSYTANELLHIVQTIPRARIRKPEALKNVNAKGLILNSPMDELLLRQRTVSMEMVDKDVRHGQPIRVDRAESADYDSMMYGEGQRRKAVQMDGTATTKEEVKMPASASKSSSTKSSWAALAAQAARSNKLGTSKPPVRKKIESKKRTTKTTVKPKDGSKSNKSAVKKKPVKVKSAPRPTGAKRVHNAAMHLSIVNPSREPRRRRGWEKAETTAATKAKLAELAASPPKTEKKISGDDTSADKKTSVDKKTVWDKRKQTGTKRRQTNASSNPEAKLDARAVEPVPTLADSGPRPPPAKWGAKKSFASILKDQSSRRNPPKPPITREGL